jgi:hypothetical protein
MNPINETVVSEEMYKRLRAEGLAEGYEPVPAVMRAKAEELLKDGRNVADMDADMKRKLRNLKKRMRKQGVPGY